MKEANLKHIPTWTEVACAIGHHFWDPWLSDPVFTCAHLLCHVDIFSLHSLIQHLNKTFLNFTGGLITKLIIAEHHAGSGHGDKQSLR